MKRVTALLLTMLLIFSLTGCKSREDKVIEALEGRWYITLAIGNGVTLKTEYTFGKDKSYSITVVEPVAMDTGYGSFELGEDTITVYRDDADEPTVFNYTFEDDVLSLSTTNGIEFHKYS